MRILFLASLYEIFTFILPLAHFLTDSLIHSSPHSVSHSPTRFVTHIPTQNTTHNTQQHNMTRHDTQHTTRHNTAHHTTHNTQHTTRNNTTHSTNTQYPTNNAPEDCKRDKWLSPECSVGCGACFRVPRLRKIENLNKRSLQSALLDAARALGSDGSGRV